jgi:ATP-dependent Clp protease ATP-binding subunit ClpC
MQLAGEARLPGQTEIAAEHILLGIAREGSGVTARIRTDLGIDLAALRRDAEQRVATLEARPNSPNVADQIIQRGHSEANQLRHNYLGTEHLLLGIASCADSSAGELLHRLGLRVDRLREQIVQLLVPGLVNS